MTKVYHKSNPAPTGGDKLTPQCVIDWVLELWPKGISLDPCAETRDEPFNIPAVVHFTIEDNGLAQLWYAPRVFVNPPYGKGRHVDKWIEKGIKEYDEFQCAQIIWLLPARTGTSWFRLLHGHPVCFVKGRLKFGGFNDKGEPLTGPAGFPSAIIGMGVDWYRFEEVFGKVGHVYVPIRHWSHLNKAWDRFASESERKAHKVDEVLRLNER